MCRLSECSHISFQLIKLSFSIPFTPPAREVCQSVSRLAWLCFCPTSARIPNLLCAGPHRTEPEGRVCASEEARQYAAHADGAPCRLMQVGTCFHLVYSMVESPNSYMPLGSNFVLQKSRNFLAAFWSRQMGVVATDTCGPALQCLWLPFSQPQAPFSFAPEQDAMHELLAPISCSSSG